ncbi:hypothetical protein CDAR_251211 [Caerostris darwini]|uniref:Uncharacterized protein n=1 Tax=Caerostris darwini TaxID=1538125 RepID=A0AAV4R9U0_9ARAC|nr:hypothetical protein CDAR_251211 [Caerostris darwini]
MVSRDGGKPVVVCASQSQRTSCQFGSGAPLQSSPVGGPEEVRIVLVVASASAFVRANSVSIVPNFLGPYETTIAPLHRRFIYLGSATHLSETCQHWTSTGVPAPVRRLTLGYPLRDTTTGGQTCLWPKWTVVAGAFRPARVLSIRQITAVMDMGRGGPLPEYRQPRRICITTEEIGEVII